MIAFVYGTTAELIKLSPVYHRLVDEGAKPLLWCTGQQLDELPVAHERLGVPGPDLWLAHGANGRSLARPDDVVIWLRSIARNVRASRRELEDALWSDHNPPLVLVHGDTMTTVLGSVLGRWLGATVGHIEAGLRSSRLLHPFPEEIDRRLTAVLAHLHFTPDAQSAHNLRRTKGVKVDTGANTVLDALALVPRDVDPGLGPIPARYGLVSLHRFELVQNRERFTEVIVRLARRARETPIYVVTDPVASAKLEEFGLDAHFDANMRRVPKLPYFEFVALLRGASFVVTDSGGLQEECAYLDTPCLVHRVTTERMEGVGKNVVVSGLDLATLDAFLDDPDAYRTNQPIDLPSPSEVIVHHLREAGYFSTRSVPSTRCDLSVIVPAYREAHTIQGALTRLLGVLDESGLDYEVIVVSDGNTDGTERVARSLERPRITVLHYADNGGKGFAVRYGFAHAKGECIAFIDADLAVEPSGIAELYALLHQLDADVVVGSKVHEDSHVQLQAFRRLQFRAFGRYVSRLFDLDVGDTQTGLKVFRREVLERVVPYARTNGFAFDIELLASANDLGHRIVEGPVATSERYRAVMRPAVLFSVLAGSLRLALLRRQLAKDRAER